MTLDTLPRPIDLSRYQPISEGIHRAVYDIPDCPGMLFKVMKSGAAAPPVSRFKRLLRRMLPRSADRAVFVETDAYMRILLHKPAVADAILPRFYGGVTTTLGPATIHEKLCAPDGTLAPTLFDLAETGRLSSEHVPLLNDLFEVLRTHHVVANDPAPWNIALSNDRFFLVDGLGDRNLIRVRTYSNWLNERSKARKCRAIAEISPHLQWNESAQSFGWVENPA